MDIHILGVKCEAFLVISGASYLRTSVNSSRLVKLEFNIKADIHLLPPLELIQTLTEK